MHVDWISEISHFYAEELDEKREARPATHAYGKLDIGPKTPSTTKSRSDPVQLPPHLTSLALVQISHGVRGVKPRLAPER